jgi:hypothetical protein
LSVGSHTEHKLAQTLLRAVHVDLDTQRIVQVELHPQFNDLIPLLGEAVAEDAASPATTTPLT